MKSAYHIIFENFMQRGRERADRWEWIVKMEQVTAQFKELGERLKKAIAKWEDVW
jgi:hypothetical protein